MTPDQAVRAVLPPAGKNDQAEPDALYPGGLSSPRLTAGERLVALALVGPWLACTAGFVLVVAAHRAVRAVLR